MNDSYEKEINKIKQTFYEPDFDEQYNIISEKIGGSVKNTFTFRIAAVVTVFAVAVSGFLAYGNYQQNNLNDYLYSMISVEDEFFVSDSYY